MSNPDKTTSTSKAATPEKSPTGCMCCDRAEDADDCVQCDQCNGWWHMSCADVTASVADRSFTCAHCLPLSVSSRTTTSSARAARLALKKKMLEEQQAMEQRHLAEKYKLLEEELQEVEETASNRSRISKRTSQERVKEWQQKCAEQSKGAPGVSLTNQSKDSAAVSLAPQDAPHDQKDPEETNPVQVDGPSASNAPLPSLGNLRMLSETATKRDEPVSGKFTSTMQQLQQNSIIAEGCPATGFGKPQWNSTAKPFGLRNPNIIGQVQQPYTGAIPKTVPYQQQVVHRSGNVASKMPPVAH